MSPKTKTTHPVEIHPAYLAELRHRIETGPGFGAVADAAGMSKTTLWRVLHGQGKQRITADAVERARLGLAFLEEGVAPMPPPLLPVQGSVHHAWMAIGERLLEKDPELFARAVENPDEVAAAIQQRLPQRKVRS